jgi:hypothetical protein
MALEGNTGINTTGLIGGRPCFAFSVSKARVKGWMSFKACSSSWLTADNSSIFDQLVLV